METRMTGNSIDQLDQTNTEAWEGLRAIAEKRTGADRQVNWKGGKQLSNRVYHIGYPCYSEQISEVIRLLSEVGAVTPLYVWMEHGLPDRAVSGKELTIGDAIRTATYMVRGERFSEGTIAAAVEKGLLDRVLHALVEWYDNE
ncbi:DUF6508 domain-containing protein [Gracilibacillus timonensis]|uniref:DUF6508 domain-containing protein n=1 Tax=Gracilibacillus timonensis TaxID=1816696 RepID=UPI0008244021|nr:DUF6508 domain-containing protein [Gracilibacillus timonensis]